MNGELITKEILVLFIHSFIFIQKATIIRFTDSDVLKYDCAT